MQLRQITSCTAPAAWALTRRTSRGALVWELFTCDRHRDLGPRLSGAVHRNTRAYRRVEGEQPRCGTLRDAQPIDEALASHSRMWLVTPLPEHGGEPGWLGRLRGAAEHESATGGADAEALAEIVREAERVPGGGDVEARVLALLAQVETASAERLRR